MQTANWRVYFNPQPKRDPLGSPAEFHMNGAPVMRWSHIEIWDATLCIESGVAVFRDIYGNVIGVFRNYDWIGQYHLETPQEAKSVDTAVDVP